MAFPIRDIKLCLRGLTVLLILAVSLQSAFASDGDPEKGKALYERRCWWCHGIEGAGDGPAAEFVNPLPRDLTFGLYKWKSTPFDEYSPSDEDFERMMAGGRQHGGLPGWDGMSGTSMPGWGDVMGPEGIRDMAAYMRSLSGLERNEMPAISLAGRIQPGPESIERGRGLFKDRCAECHGLNGRGDGTKKLRDDWGARTWPRDLTKGWTFRAGTRPEDIYTRVTVGIPGTQMPSFADPSSKKAMTEEERWDVANYAASLDEPSRRTVPEMIIRAVKVEGSLPLAHSHKLWDSAPEANYFLFPQIIAGEKAFTPSLNSISVKALHNGKEAAFLLEWNDPTNSRPWDTKSIEIADGPLFPDGAAIQFPAGEVKGGRPYFGMGDGRKPVVIWHWRSPESESGEEAFEVMEAKGFERIERKTLSEADGFVASGTYDNGRWRVVMKGLLNHENGPLFEEGLFTPVAFALWDGSNGDSKGKHVMTGWEWVRLEKETSGPSYMWPLAAGGFVLAAEMFWLFLGRGRKD
ncbi:MAG: c-type cytochrome [Deltaproteobacteria bacterium]|nr:c-type cytochrome [Deltaproteobacteria bacterium]MBZ0219395.1 c-type cytochrome [Deltaproteobacteria bacterium]